MEDALKEVALPPHPHCLPPRLQIYKSTTSLLFPQLQLAAVTVTVVSQGAVGLRSAASHRSGVRLCRRLVVELYQKTVLHSSESHQVPLDRCLKAL